MLTDEDKAIRARRIGASEVACVLGISPYGGPFDVYARIVHGIGRADAPELTVGRYLERAVLDWFRDNAGEYRISTAVSGRAHPRYGWLSATPDAALLVPDETEPRALIECKTDRSRDAWGEPDTDQVPMWYAAQCQAQMAVFSMPRVYVPVLFTQAYEFALYVVERDEAVIDAILTHCGAWYERHVVTGEMPALDGGSAAGEYLRRRYPTNNGELAEATPEQAGLAREYVAAKTAEGEASERAAVLRQRLILEIGERDGLRLTDGESILFRADKRGQRSLRLAGFKDRKR